MKCGQACIQLLSISFLLSSHLSKQARIILIWRSSQYLLAGWHWAESNSIQFKINFFIFVSIEFTTRLDANIDFFFLQTRSHFLIIPYIYAYSNHTHIFKTPCFCHLTLYNEVGVSHPILFFFFLFIQTAEKKESDIWYIWYSNARIQPDLAAQWNKNSNITPPHTWQSTSFLASILYTNTTTIIKRKFLVFSSCLSTLIHIFCQFRHKWQ